jgi:magnesium chelatase family protein
MSEPLLDRIDMRVGVPRVPYRELREKSARETSETVRARVRCARDRMRRRFAGTRRRCNAELTAREIDRHCPLDDGSERMMATAVSSRRVSARGVHRLMRVARTIADLAETERITVEHLALAVLLRGQT